jgi:hypothetical protein
MKKLIKKILKEDRRQMFLNKIVHVMKNDYPLFKNLKDYGLYDQLSKDELNYIFSEIFGEPVRHSYGHKRMYGIDGRILDKKGYSIYYEGSYGYWKKREFDENNNMIYQENSDGDWEKSEYDENGNRIYFENSDDYWEKREFDENGNLIYFEDSNGVIIDKR